MEKYPEVSFVYIHGSFTKDQDFKDIDVAVYLKDIPLSPLQYELKIEVELMNIVSPYPADVRTLNSSPLSFKYHVIKEGTILAVKDNDVRAEFQENTLINYFDFAPFRKQYLMETIGVGI